MFLVRCLSGPMNNNEQQRVSHWFVGGPAGLEPGTRPLWAADQRSASL